MNRTREKKEVYINPFQEDFVKATQPMVIGVAGRGVGKSATIGIRNRLQMSNIARAKIFFASTTYNQILTKTLPSIEQMWNQFGLREYISPAEPGHYVIGKKPPREFMNPYSPPRKYMNVISFFNGFTIELLSMDRPDLARGGSYDGGEIDEAALIKQEFLTKVLLPSVRGNRHRFRHYMHQQVAMYTSMPWKQSGQYILDYEQKAKAYPDEYFYREATALENIEILGQKGIDRLRREMSPLEFEVEVMNKRITRVEDGFYHAFDEEKHTYTPGYKYAEGERGIFTESRKDYNNEHLLELSFDFSGWFNGVLVIQTNGKTEQVIDSFYTKEERKIAELVDDFCDAYMDHKFKMVRVWGEPRGWDKNPTGPAIYAQIQQQLTARGWQVDIRARAERTAEHVLRHHFMNEVLKEQMQNLPVIRINDESCKDLIIAIHLTEITPDFKKNKKKERDRTFPQEHAPHFTDMLDYYIYGKYSHFMKGMDRKKGNRVTFG